MTRRNRGRRCRRRPRRPMRHRPRSVARPALQVVSPTLPAAIADPRAQVAQQMPCPRRSTPCRNQGDRRYPDECTVPAWLLLRPSMRCTVRPCCSAYRERLPSYGFRVRDGAYLHACLPRLFSHVSLGLRHDDFPWFRGSDGGCLRDRCDRKDRGGKRRREAPLPLRFPPLSRCRITALSCYRTVISHDVTARCHRMAGSQSIAQPAAARSDRPCDARPRHQPKSATRPTRYCPRRDRGPVRR